MQCVTVYYMLVKSGSGLRLVPHKLLSGKIQFEGYDKDNQHLFTFTLANESEEDTADGQIVKTTRRTNSGFTADDGESSMRH